MTNNPDKKNSTTEHFLVIDFGNTLVKVAVFRDDDIVATETGPELTIETLEAFQNKYQMRYAIFSSVVHILPEIHAFLKGNFQLTELTHQTPVPLNNLYKSPETLGKDRLAAAVAANAMFPGSHVLALDAGTCVTFDFVDDGGNYHGGGISPGIQMRFKALHTFTQRLPLVKHQNFEALSGATTEESILSGVLNGIVEEFDGIIRAYQKKYDEMKVVVTGGDMKFFAKKLKSNIFATPNLVLRGLNEILKFNVKQQQKIR